MPSIKQLDANRANAKRSTGPRTGKARSRANSWKHGLTGKRLVIEGEGASNFDELRASLLDNHDPQSVFEYASLWSAWPGSFGPSGECLSSKPRLSMPAKHNWTTKRGGRTPGHTELQRNLMAMTMKAMPRSGQSTWATPLFRMARTAMGWGNLRAMRQA